METANWKQCIMSVVCIKTIETQTEEAKILR